MAHPQWRIAERANLRARRRTAMPHFAANEHNPAARTRRTTTTTGFRLGRFEIYSVKPII
jgi:hypothetical protein